jgi:hypothetical protein
MVDTNAGMGKKEVVGFSAVVEGRAPSSQAGHRTVTRICAAVAGPAIKVAPARQATKHAEFLLAARLQLVTSTFN